MMADVKTETREREEPEDELCFGDPERGFRLPVPLEPHHHRPGPLPLGIRIGIFVLGWVLVLVGVAGLVLPGIQGVITIVAGAALLSLDNDLVYRGLRRCLGRWPRIWDKVEGFRAKAHAKLHRFRSR